MSAHCKHSLPLGDCDQEACGLAQLALRVVENDAARNAPRHAGDFADIVKTIRAAIKKARGEA